MKGALARLGITPQMLRTRAGKLKRSRPTTITTKLQRILLDSREFRLY